MTTDNAAAYTFYPCTDCTSVSMTNVSNSCTDVGLEMIIPRSYNHWVSMVNLLTDSLIDPAIFFQVIPGISKPIVGKTPCLGGTNGIGIMNSGYCSSVTDSWRAIDNGTWWIRDNEYTEPNGE